MSTTRLLSREEEVRLAVAIEDAQDAIARVLIDHRVFREELLRRRASLRDEPADDHDGGREAAREPQQDERPIVEALLKLVTRRRPKTRAVRTVRSSEVVLRAVAMARQLGYCGDRRGSVLGAITPTLDRGDSEAVSAALRSEGEAKEALTRANLRLVVSIARRYRNRGVALADL